MSQHEIDVTGDICPFTFVKTKLLVERMHPGDTATVRLRGAESLKNVPRSLRDHGHDILSLEEESGEGVEGVHRLLFRKRSDGNS